MAVSKTGKRRRTSCGIARNQMEGSLSCSLMTFVLSGCQAEHRSRLMSWSEYSRKTANDAPHLPYVVHLRCGRGELLYIGSPHTNDPARAELAEIEARWKASPPEIAFNEGGDPPIEINRNDAVKKFGESGLVRYLAAESHIP